jgi:hypothetical protein
MLEERKLARVYAGDRGWVTRIRFVAELEPETGGHRQEPAASRTVSGPSPVHSRKVRMNELGPLNPIRNEIFGYPRVVCLT